MMLALIGINANAAMYIVGSDPFGGWDEPNLGVEMTLMEDGVTYSYEFTMPGTYPNENSLWFVFSEGHGTWASVNPGRYDSGLDTDLDVSANVEFNPVKGNSNKSFKFTGTAGNNYTVTFNPNTLVAKVAGVVLPPPSGATWTVAGQPAVLFGDPTWQPGNTANDMTLVNGLYTWTKENVELPAGNILFKVVKNHSWGTAYPSENFSHNVEKAGPYNVTITFNETTHEIKCVTEPVGALADNTYIVAGTENLFGSNWNPGDSANLMVKNPEGIYTLTKENIPFLAGSVVEFKVVANNNWDSCWPNDNVTDTIDADGIYTVVITFNEEDKAITFTPTKTGDLPVETEKVYILGNIDDHEFVADKGAEMAFDETTKVYTAEINVHNAPESELGYFGFTKRLGQSANDWDAIAAYRFGPMADEGTVDWVMTESLLNQDCELDLENGTHYSIAIPAGTWNVTVDLVSRTFKINGTWPTDTVIPEPEMVYTLVGDAAVFGTAWDTVDENNANLLVKGENGIYTWSKDEVTLYHNFQYKVVGNHKYEIYQWPLSGNETAVLPDGPGIYTVAITFDPEAEAKLTCTLTKTGDAPEIEHTYTVAGTPASFFGTEWDATNTENDMVKGEDGLYTWTKTDVVFEGNDSIYFKVVMDHNWNNSCWPADNYECIIHDAGTYDIVITFNEETEIVNMVVTKQGPEHTYTVAGAPASIFGTEWDATNANNDMTLGEDGIYTWTKAIEVTDSTFIEAKVCVDHAWNESYPDGYGYNAKVTVAPGSYNLVVTFDPESKVVTITAVEPWALGDVNHDHFVNVADVTALIKYILTSGAEPEEFYTEQANVDGDAADVLNVADVTALIQVVLNQ